ncbi:MAG: RsmB/NOP family class I SAM-dependent RNA methyltransferase [Oceanipulchritudo sp.]
MSGQENGGEEHWREAVDLLCRWESGRAHLDELLEHAELDRLRWLVMESFRQWLVIERILSPHVRRTPRPQLRQLLRLALGECLQREASTHPRVVHHAVGVSRRLGLSPAEAGFLNAVLRNILRDWEKWKDPPLEWSHPGWLVRRWEKQFGREATRQLLRWNQDVPHLTVQGTDCPAYAEPTAWPGFYRLRKGRFPEALADLRKGTTYVQDPFTRIPVELLDPRPGETILDLCAAPGGKTRLIAGRMRSRGRLLAVDLEGKRLERLRENASRIPGIPVEVIGASVENLPGNPGDPGESAVDGVLIDVPCSNTGVIQKRPDVKLRLRECEIRTLADRQSRLLELASAWVRPGGRLVYSTCSIEEEENRAVVEAFCSEHPDWGLARGVMSRPWECGHDGGGAFLLTRNPPH